MKIAIHNAQFSYHLGGTERLIYDQIRHLINYHGVKLTLITSKTKFKSRFFKKIEKLKGLKVVCFDGIESLKIPNYYNSNNPKKWHSESFIFGSEAYNYYKTHKFSLVITHFSTDSLFIPANQKNILHLHGTPLTSSELGVLSVKRPDAFVSVSQNVKQGWIKLYPELNRKLIEVIYPNIDHKKFKPMSLKKDIDILFVGRFILIKGIYDLLGSIKKLKKEVKVVLIGDGPEREKIKQKIKKLKFADKIRIISNISDKELSKMYNKTKIAVFPSYAKEGMVLAMLESASSGAAIITSKACSMPEFIKEYDTGLLAKPQNPIDLAKKINILLGNRALRNRLGRNARKKIVKEWNTKKRIHELYQFYQRTAKND